ncbi:MAG: MFS transporter [Pseudomonadota bacterium]|nr:MFS transporter [Pseudomonadota bacterium]
MNRRVGTVAALGTAQTLAWASSYYLPAMLAAPMARELGLATPTIFAAFSLALLVSAVLGPLAGRMIDRHGGRLVLVATNGVFALGLAGLGAAQGPWSLFAAWVVLGIGMGSGLYEAAFATLVRLYGRDSRGAITGITLIAGFASTVGWPLSAYLESHIGWRGACFVWAALHLLLGAPLNASLPNASRSAAAGPLNTQGGGADEVEPVASKSAAPLLAIVFALTWFISTAMAAHLPSLLERSGVTVSGAAAIGALVGPAQVAGRLLEFGLLRRVHPLLSARLATLMHPLGAMLLLVFGAPAAAVFAVLHGAGNGILTIAKGTLPLVFFGARGYGLRQGFLTFPARIGQALAPWLFGMMLARWSTGALWLSAALGMTAFGALLWLANPDAPHGKRDRRLAPN